MLLSVLISRTSGTLDRVVASNTRGPKFKSSHWQLLLSLHLLPNVNRKDSNKEKEAAI